MEDIVRELVQGVHDSSTKAVVAVAGAGTEAISWLLDVAGASRTVLEIIVPYSPSSFVDFIGHEQEQFVSVEAARSLAKAAYRRALVLRDGANQGLEWHAIVFILVSAVMLSLIRLVLRPKLINLL